MTSTQATETYVDNILEIRAVAAINITKKDESKTKEDESKTKEDESKTKDYDNNGNDDSDDDDDDDDYSNQIPVDPRYLLMDQFVYAKQAYEKNPSPEAFAKMQNARVEMNENGIFMRN